MTDSSVTPSAIRADYPEPLWIQAINLLREEIAGGRLKPGSRLPPERELCQQLGISRVTLRKALNHLVDEGVLSASHGRGWYVAGGGLRREWPDSLESFTETARRLGLTPSSAVIRDEVHPSTLDEAEQLSIAPGTELFHLERVRCLDDVPIALDHTRIPIALVPDIVGADFRRASLFEWLADAGVDVARAEATIEARAADVAAATHLQLEIGRPLLVLHQLVVDRRDRPVFASTVQYSGERYRLRTSFGRAAARTGPRGG